MSQVMVIARLLANLMGVSFDQDVACWQSYVPTDTHQYACQYEGNTSWFFVGRHWDGSTEVEYYNVG